MASNIPSRPIAIGSSSTVALTPPTNSPSLNSPDSNKPPSKDPPDSGRPPSKDPPDSNHPPSKDPPDSGDPQEYVVQGKVLQVDGTPLLGCLVTAVDVDLRREQTLGSCLTGSPGGTYRIGYKSDQFKRAERLTADLKIYVYHIENNTDNKTVLATSPVMWNAPLVATIDVIVGGTEVKGISEFDALRAKILPLLEDLSPADLVEDSTHQDITFLVGETGEERQRIQLFVLAYQAQAKTKVDPDIFYGFFREGVPTDLTTLLGRNPAQLKQALKLAMSQNVIRMRVDEQIDVIIRQLADMGIQHSVQPPGSTTKSPLGSLLGTTLSNPTSFVDSFAKFDGTSTDAFWKGLQDKPEFKGKVEELQSTVQLGILTLSHTPLVQELQQQQKAGSLKDFSDLSRFTFNDWTHLLQKPEIGVPPEIPGRDNAEKVQNYANAMTRIVEDSFPTKFLVNRMADPEDNKLGALPAKLEVLSFFKKNTDFNFTNIRLQQYLSKNPNALDGIENPTVVKSTISAIQRIYAIAPQYTQTRALVSAGINSAMQISRMGQTAFTATYGGLLGGQGEALKIFDRAEQSHAMSFNLIANWGWANSRVFVPIWTEPVITSTQVEAAIPDLSTLFGSLDLCSCEDCRSVDGPAAYLVDILHFLRDRRLIDKITRDANGVITGVTFKRRRIPGTNITVEINVKDVLFQRRPDIGEVELNCQNTNTPLPYIDLTIEVLENAISPFPTFASFTLPANAFSDLDARLITNFKSSFNPPLDNLAVVTVMKQGEWWTIDEQAFTYTVRKEGSNVRVLSRSLQTKGTAAERAANPQYMNTGAYNLLRGQVYPWSLPFDLWIETVRTYLAHVDVKRYDVMTAFSNSDKAATLSRTDIAFERLGLTAFEASIVSGVTIGQSGSATSGIWNLWGFGKELLDTQNGTPDPADKSLMIMGGRWSSVLISRVDVFLRQSGLKYNELLNLMEFSEIFGGKSPIDIRPQEGANADTCELMKLQIVGADEAVLHRICRFVRLLRKLSGWSVLDLGQAYRALGATPDKAGTEALLVALSHIQRLQTTIDLPLESILTFWSPLSTVAYIDHQSSDEDIAPASLFARVFHDQTITNQADPIFTGDPANLAGTISGNTSAITAALNVGATELAALAANKDIVADDVLSLDNLSKLYRHTALGKTLGVSVSDYLSLLKLQSSNIFTNTLTTVTFVDRVNGILSSGFTLTELSYLLRHDFTEDSGVSAPDESESALLEDIRGGLQKIARENTFDETTTDDNGALTKKKLALLNWDTVVIAQAIGILNDTVSFSAPLAVALSDGFLFPTDVKDKVTYDSTSLRLTYSRVMTNADRDELLGIAGASSGFKDAINLLYSTPRTFFSRNMRTFSVPSFQAPLASMPTTVKVPATLEKRVFFNASDSTLNCVGAMTDSERQALLANTSATADVQYIDAVNKLFAAPDSLIPAVDDSFLTATDVAGMFDSANNVDGPIVPRTRFAVVLQKLLPKLRNSLSSQFVTQKIGQSIGLENQIAEPLLQKWVKLSSGTADALFRSDAFVSSSSSSPVTKKVFGDQFSVLTLLRKIGMLIAKFRITKKQLGWLFDFRSSAGDPTVGWLDLNALPLQPVAAGAGNIEGWERLVALFRLRDALPLGENTLNAVFVNARTVGVTTNDLLSDLCQRANWSLADVTYLVGPQGFNFSLPAAFQDELALTSLLNVLKLIRKIGCSAADGALYAKADQGEQQARAIVQTVKSKYDRALWLTVARPLRNILRDRQRGALESYMLAHPIPGVIPIWRNSNDLYAYYLMDVEMGPCQLTSRIKQAISVTQLFVQRCLMNLERDVLADSEYDIRWIEWNTLKSFRLTSASRQIFEKPENFLNSSLRDDKSPFFEDLETELRQADLTQDTAEVALRNYVEKLDQVARLEVVSYYHQKEADATGNVVVDIMHVIGRTRGQPALYFYRTRVDSAEWTAWEKVDVDISGNHLIPVIWNRRLHLFWGLINEKQQKDNVILPQPNQAVPAGPTFWEIKLAWSELKNGKWLAKSMSDDFLICWKSGRNGVLEDIPLQKLDGKSLLTFKAVGGGDNPDLRIECLQDVTAPGIIGYFAFDGVRGSPVAVDTTSIYAQSVEPWRYTFPSYVMTPTGTKLQNMTFAEEQPGTSLYLQDSDFNDIGFMQSKEDLLPEKSEVLVLKKTPGRFNLVYPHQDQQFSSQRPFFFQHQNKSFFVEPSDVAWWFRLRDIFNPTLLNPIWLNGSIFKKYIDRPEIPRINIPFPDPPIVGPMKFQPSFDLTGLARPITDPRVIARSGLENLAFSSDVTRSLAASDVVRSTSFFERVKPVRLNTSKLRYPIHLPWPKTKRYKFSLFYHPFVPEFIRHLNRDGIDGLLQRPLQQSSNVFFKNDYDPDAFTVLADEYPDEVVDFDNGSMSQYNWELFFHVPLMIAERLSQNQRFQEAQKWFHYIFDPTDTSQLSSPRRYWRTKKFFDTEDPTYSKESIQNLLRFLATRGDPAESAKLSAKEQQRLTDLEESVRRWRKNPFNPYLVARTRTTAFQKAVVMKYLDNLIAWGDQLFRGDTIELINEATQLFILAADILGERPVEISPRATARVQTYNTLEPLLDGFSNALVQIEELVPPSTAGPSSVLARTHQTQVATSTMLYFCVPKNDKLLSYWDVVADRLFKIRNCMNLQGIVRELALFEPPIDPALLVKAAASGADLGSVLSDLNAPLPHYRYSYMAARAMEVCNELRGLGGAFLAALEKKDAEGMALLRSSHEMKTLDAVRLVKVQNVAEALEGWNALNKGKDVVAAKLNFYTNVAFMNPWEITHLALEGTSLAMQIIEAATQPVAAVASLIPDLKIGAPTSIGATWGGQNLHYSASYFGAFLNRAGAALSKGGAMAATMGSHQRRKDDWDLQATLAQRELDQYDRQIAGALIRRQIADQDLSNHDLQIKNTKEIDDYMRSKLTNQELYDWMIGQLTTIYFQSYQMAYDAAKRAERAFVYELGMQQTDFVQFGYWDSLKKGLLAGEKLAYDLRRMDLAYIDQDQREYEITRSVSLAQLDPVALIQLKEISECFFALPEALFDLDFPGHYFRRIKSVSLTVPCVVGPYTSISSTLTLLKSSVRIASTATNGVYARRDNDVRFNDSYAQAQSIATSSGQNDSGLFELNFRDERYLPFERSGAVSSWRLQLPPAGMTAFDTQTISDVIVHVRYTAREAGEPLRSLATTELRNKTLDAIGIAEGQTGLARLFSLRHEFPDAWHRLFHPASATAKAEMQLPLTTMRFPFLFRAAKALTFSTVEAFIRIRPEFLKTTHSAAAIKLTFSEASTADNAGNDPLGLTEWNGVLRGAKRLGGKPAGMYVLRMNLDGGSPVLEEAVEELLLVVHYGVKFA